VQDISEAELKGIRPYSPIFLRMYDLQVLWFNNRFIWRCPTAELVRLYNDNLSGDHLDVGCGTAYHLRHARYPTEQQQITLVDLNKNSLHESSRRLRGKRGIEAVTHLGSALAPLPVDRRYQSVAANFLMHCIPGTWAQGKGAAFRHIADVTADDGVFFGSSVLAHGVTHTKRSRAKVAEYNDRGIMHNEGDDLDGLTEALARAFAEVSVRTIGAVALWTARQPHRSPVS
jgi:SAM-dependent methyltransferase